MRYTNGKPAILSRKVGAGDVLFIATSADPGPSDPKSNDPTWNDLQGGWIGWVPFVQSCLTHLLERQTQKHNFIAGETIRWQPDDSDAEAVFVLIPPKLANGRQATRPRLGRPRDEDGKPLLVTPVLDRAGIYYLTPASREHDEQTVKPGAGQRAEQTGVGAVRGGAGPARGGQSGDVDRSRIGSTAWLSGAARQRGRCHRRLGAHGRGQSGVDAVAVGAGVTVDGGRVGAGVGVWKSVVILSVVRCPLSVAKNNEQRTTDNGQRTR